MINFGHGQNKYVSFYKSEQPLKGAALFFIAKKEKKMNPKSKEARERLKMATRAEFEHLVYEAMLTPWCEKILRLHIGEGVSVCNLAERFSCSETLIRKHLSTAYGKVAKVQ
jgi:DNA-binding NarL/FixJ family response regulator